MEKPSTSRSGFGMLSVSLAVAATGVHFWAGWADAGHLVLRPVGHIAILAAMAWLVAMVVALLVAAFSRRGRTQALGALAGCALGMLMLLSA